MKVKSNMTMSHVDLAKLKVKQIAVSNYLINMGLSFTMLRDRVIVSNISLPIEEAEKWCEESYESYLRGHWESIARIDESIERLATQNKKDRETLAILRKEVA